MAHVLQRAELALGERQKALEDLGIDIQSGGIGVDRSKCYLFNMSADPSLSALLLYQLKVLLAVSESAIIDFWHAETREQNRQ